jgi:photosystem II stability/assembly factor-like uncharacterized protein
MEGLGCTADAVSATTLWGFCLTGLLGYAMRSPDGGRHFANVKRSTDAGSIIPLSADEAMLACQCFPNGLLTRDGGAHFLPLISLKDLGGAFILDMACANMTTWLMLAGNSIWRTANGGRSWRTVKLPSP